MKILLIGEYSRLHNSLKEGLIKLGHEVTLVGTGDDFKDYPVDIKIRSIFKTNKLLKPFTKLIDKVFKVNPTQIEHYYRVKLILHKLKDYDIVQLINENSFKTTPNLEIKLLKKLFAQNKKVFLLTCGTDYISVKYANEKKFRYSILTPYQNNSELKDNLRYIVKYITEPYKKLHSFLYKNIEGVIATDLDYHIPIKDHPNYLGMIPNPVNIDKIKYKLNEDLSVIHIFHGVNSLNYIKKGNQFFDDALKIIEDNYPNKVKITRVENIPYNVYIKLFDSSHIVLDQVYAYDQGYNALEAMAKGKVLFTGAEQEWIEYYKLKEDSVAINSLPDVKHIVNKLEWLINNPEKIIEISRNARSFIEKEHDFLKITQQYLKTWDN